MDNKYTVLPLVIEADKVDPNDRYQQITIVTQLTVGMTLFLYKTND
jgi:hypothetical protein